MIALQTDLPGKRDVFQKLKQHLEELGFHIVTGNKYYGYFKALLSSHAGKKLYLHLPYRLLQEKYNQSSVQMEFRCPTLTYYIAGRSSDVFTNFVHQSDFYDWKRKGEQAVQQIINHIDNNL